MPTDSGTFQGCAPIVIGGGGSAPNNSGGNNGGGSGGGSGQFAIPNFTELVTVGAAVLGAVAVIVALVPAGVGAIPVQASPYPSGVDAVVLGNTTPQLLRSPETENQEAAKVHAKECANLKVRYDDARKQADFASAMEAHSRQLLATALQKLPREYLQEYLKDKIKDAAAEIPIDIMMAFIGAAELEVLAEICKKAATTLIAEEPGVYSDNLGKLSGLHCCAGRSEEA